jgi:anti-anti-sigma regulatory factor
MRFKKEYEGDVVILSPSHYLFGGTETDELEGELLRLLSVRKRKILIDFGHTCAVNCMAISMLLRVHRTIQERNALWCFCNVDKRIKRPLIILKLIRLFNVCVSRAEALNALSEDPVQV